jgi:Zn-dependent peptidase ImmA (M78 family)
VRPLERPSFLDEAEEHALALRAKLGLGSDALGDVFELVGHLGLTVLRRPMGNLDGVYVKRGNTRLIVVNSAHRLPRQRFTAAHELAHDRFDQVSHLDPDVFSNQDVAERRANAFAAFFLMPRDGVERWLRHDQPSGGGSRSIDEETVVHLARHFGMSYEATLYQLRDLGWLNGNAAEDLAQVQSERVARRLGYDVDADLADEGRLILPPDYVRRALCAYEGGDISLPRLAELLHTEVGHAEQIARDADALPKEPTLEELIAEARNA